MGIPAFFRLIVEKYPNTHNWDPNRSIDHFFIDFNSIIYDCYHGIKTDDKTEFEPLLIEKVLEYTTDLVMKYVRPKKTIYIAFDGPAPMAKIVQQRSRRYKSIIEREFQERVGKKYGINNKSEWEKAKISPGTEFMHNLSKAFVAHINAGKLSDATITLSDSSVPGEGEHKFMPIIRNLPQDDSVCIYSPDADVIVLAMSSHKNNINILRHADPNNRVLLEKYVNNKIPYFYLSIDAYKDAFIEQIGIKGKDNNRVIDDYIFITFFGGNDFIIPIPYLRMNKEDSKASSNSGLNIVLNAYITLTQQSSEYLIENKDGKYNFNTDLFLKIVEIVAEKEQFYLQRLQEKMYKVMKGYFDQSRIQKEEGKTPYEIEMGRIQHTEYYSPLNPDFELYVNKFKEFDYTKPVDIWKEKYYNHYFGISRKDIKEYDKYRENICANYLEAFVFTFKYYMCQIPSWSWNYQFIAPPVMSDILHYLRTGFNLNSIEFDISEPLTPLTQLLIILPPQLSHILPVAYSSLMNNELVEYFPISCKLNVILGEKFIYSETLLPELDRNHIVDCIKQNTSKLSEDELKRDVISDKPYTRDITEKPPKPKTTNKPKTIKAKSPKGPVKLRIVK